MGKRESEKVRDDARQEVAKAKAEELCRFARGLVHFWDDLAAMRISDEELSSQPDSVQRLHKGMEMTHAVLSQAATRFGLAPFTVSAGDVFDPKLHQLEQRWVYRPVNEKAIAVREAADVDSPRTGVQIRPGQEFLVAETCLGDDDVTFLRLSQGG